MDTAQIIARFWDYGWLCHDTVRLSVADSDEELIQRYVASSAFHTSFLHNYNDETGIHGPFEACRISASDYVPLYEEDLGRYLASVAVSETPGADDVERARLLPHLHGAFAGNRRCYVLRCDERDREICREATVTAPPQSPQTKVTKIHALVKNWPLNREMSRIYCGGWI